MTRAMISRKVARVLKYGVFSGVVVGGALAASGKYSDDVSSNALVRLTRSACTAVEIARVYQSMLYSQQWDRNSKEYAEVRSEAHKIGAKKLLELCQANKGVYIKVGQHVGALDYLLPNEYVNTMRILHKDAPRNHVEDLYKVIREELKKEPKEIFLEFEEEPLGTASLAQVHKAKLKDNTEVAVKVQHFFVRDNIAMDLIWMEFLIKVMAKIFPDFQMQWLVDETKKNINIELDFLQEANNAEKVAELFGNYKWLKVPKVFREYCSSRVLVMEYVEGGQVNDVKYIDKHNIDRVELCTKLGDLYSHMIFVTGFVHSDPHPGNILVRQDPGDKELSIFLLDHGLYAQLTEKFRFHYSKLWLSIISRNTAEMKVHASALGVEPKLYGLFSCMVSGRPWESIMKGIDKTKPSDDEKMIFQDQMPNFMAEISQCLETVDRQALLILKTNDLIRSIEYGLGLQERMCGFMVMTKCCMESVYQLEHKKASTMKKQILTIKYVWSLLLLYIYGYYLNIINNFNLG